MKVSEIRKVLAAFAEIEQLGQDTSRRSALQALSLGLTPPKDATDAATLKKLAKLDFANVEDVGAIVSGVMCRDLSLYIASCSKALMAAKAKAASADLDSLSSFLSTLPEMDVGPLAMRIHTSLNSAPAKKKATSKLPAKLDHVKVREFADRLTAANFDGDRFRSVIEELQAKGTVSNAELYAIADQYMGGKSKYSSKADAIKRMKSRQYQDVLHESRARVIDRVMV